ncbi:mycobacterial-type methylenetetrahydrofolate reductase [Mycolicibacterium insubricum]|uniref:mycobacterial-type methylenetetrahydrofolate reductase n=1 Tax=Mycolicibacterium insubricum TaxID=444597 RepID=UPI003908B917
MQLNTVALELVRPTSSTASSVPTRTRRRCCATARSPASPGASATYDPGDDPRGHDRPMPMKPKLDVLDFWSILGPELPG